MRYFIALVTAFFLSAAAVAAPARVQGNGANIGATGATSFGVTLTATVTSGDTIVGAVSYESSATLTSVTDDKGNTYNLETAVTDTGNGQTTTGFSLSNITNAPQTLTAAFNKNTFSISIVGDEFSGIATASSDQRDSTAHGGQAQSSPGTATNGVTSGSFTTATNGDLLYAVTANDTGDDTGTLAAGTTTSATYALTGTSSGTSSNNCAMIKSAWGTQSTAGASTAGTFTQSVNAARVTFLIAVKAGGSPPPGGVTRRSLTGAGQ